MNHSLEFKTITREPPSIIASKLTELVETSGYMLPNYFRSLILSHNVFRTDPHEYYVEAPGGEHAWVEIDYFFGSSADPDFDLSYMHGFFVEEFGMPRYCVPVARSNANYFYLDLRDGNVVKYFRSYLSNDDPLNCFLVAQNIVQFLERIAKAPD